MRVIIINKEGLAWEFDSVEKARPNIKKEMLKEYVIENGVRVYDNRK